MPAEVTFPDKSFFHYSFHDLPVRREGENVNAERLEGSLGIFQQCLSKEAVVKLDDEWTDAVVLDQVVESECAVFATREWHDAVVLMLAPEFLNENVELFLASGPVYFAVLIGLLAADVANASLVEFDGFICFRQSTPIAFFQILGHSNSSGPSITQYLPIKTHGEPLVQESKHQSLS